MTNQPPFVGEFDSPSSPYTLSAAPGTAIPTPGPLRPKAFGDPTRQPGDPIAPPSGHQRDLNPMKRCHNLVESAWANISEMMMAGGLDLID